MSTPDRGSPPSGDPTEPAAAASTGPARSILSFWPGSSSATSSSAGSSASAVAPPAPKRRRRKGADDLSTQARIASGSGVWGVQRAQGTSGDTHTVDGGSERGASIGNGNGNGNGHRAMRAKDGGEEEEIKEMARRLKAENGSTRKPRGRRSKEDLRAVASVGDNGPAHSPSPSSRKRAARKSAVVAALAPVPSPTSPSREIIIVPSSSPHAEDIVLTGHSPQRIDPSHPFYLRVPSGSSRHDAIDVHANGNGNRNGHLAALDPEIQVVAGPSSPRALPSAPRPKAIVGRDPSKPTHSFFSRLTGTTARSSRDSSVTSELSAAPTPSTSTEQPTLQVPPSADLKRAGPVGVGAKPAKVHTFFKTNGAGSQEGKLKSGWGQVKDGEEWLPPWPRGDWPNHTGASYVIPPAINGTVKRRKLDTTPDAFHSDLDANAPWTSILSLSQDAVRPLAPAALATPARSRSNGRGRGQRPEPDRESWCEHFRPKKAADVLGNETEATYLRDWLSALSVGHKEGIGPKIQRRIKKRRSTATGDKEWNDWIDDDIGLFGGIKQEEDEEVEEEVESYLDLELDLNLGFGKRPTRYPPLSTRLANTMVLAGPSGSGKSAAVYAAATELGWDVFEVYPGIGKRTGAALMALVGDVGKNHMVVKAKEAEQDFKAKAKDEKGGFKSFFSGTRDRDRDRAKGVETLPPPSSQGSAAEPIEVEVDSPPIPSKVLGAEGTKEESKVRQSLILIDEVDILYDEEASFWPAVISLIGESKRPVVFTCNDVMYEGASCPPNLDPDSVLNEVLDIERVMVDQIPLQAILHFQPPSRELAMPYLQSLAQAAKIPEAQDYARGIYESSFTSFSRHMLDQPLPPNGNEWLRNFDLRRAITQMQLDRGHPADDTLHSPKPGQQPSAEADLRSVARSLDALSYADAAVDTRASAHIEVNELDRYSPTPDDEMGIRALVKPQVNEDVPVLPGYDHCHDIATELVALAGTDQQQQQLGNDRDLHQDRTTYIRSLLPLLDPLIPLSAHLLPHPSLFMDYLPVIQSIIRADDILEADYNAAAASGAEWLNRKTGRPVRLTAVLAREGYSRYFPEVEMEGLEVGRREWRWE